MVRNRFPLACLALALCAFSPLPMPLPVINPVVGAFMPPVGQGGCVENETATVTVRFNGTSKDLSEIKSLLDAKISEIKSLAGEQHFAKFHMQSKNYSINSRSFNNFNDNNDSSEPETQFNYNGTASFTILPADKAVEFMRQLSKRGYHANINVNSYSNGNCDSQNDAAPKPPASGAQ